MSSEVLIKESLSANSFGSIKSSFKKGEISPFQDFITEKSKEPKTKLEPEFSTKTKEDGFKKSDSSRSSEDFGGSEGFSANRENYTINSSEESNKNTTKDVVIAKTSEADSEEVITAEEIEYNQDEAASILVPVPGLLEKSLILEVDDELSGLSDFQVDKVKTLPIMILQENKKLLEQGSVGIDSTLALIDEASFLKTKKEDSKTLPLITPDKQSLLDLSSLLEEPVIFQIEKKDVIINKSSDLNLNKSISEIIESEKQTNSLSTLLEFESQSPELLGQAVIANPKQSSKILKDNLPNNLSAETELTGLFEKDDLEQIQLRNPQLKKREVAKNAENVANKTAIFSENEISFDQNQQVLDGLEKFSDFVIINDSKSKPEISFNSDSLVVDNKTSIIKPQEQLSLSLRYAVSQDKSEVTINLYPKSLGAIDVKIEFATNSSGQSEVQKVIIVAERNSTLKLLENTKSHLETALAELKKEAASTVTDTSKKETSLQFDMRDGNNGQPNEGYFGSFDERANWMNKFRNLTASDSDATVEIQESDNAKVGTKRNIHNATTVDIEV